MPRPSSLVFGNGVPFWARLAPGRSALLSSSVPGGIVNLRLLLISGILLPASVFAQQPAATTPPPTQMYVEPTMAYTPSLEVPAQHSGAGLGGQGPGRGYAEDRRLLRGVHGRGRGGEAGG